MKTLTRLLHEHDFGRFVTVYCTDGREIDGVVEHAVQEHCILLVVSDHEKVLLHPTEVVGFDLHESDSV